MATFDAGSIEGSLDLDLTPFNQALDQALARVNNEWTGKKFDANLGLDTAEFISELDRMKAKLDEFKREAATATARVDVDRAEFDRLLVDLERFGHSRYVAKAVVDVEGLAELERLRALLAGLPNRTDIDVNVDTHGGEERLSRMNILLAAAATLLPVIAAGAGAATAVVGALGGALVTAGVGFGALALVAVPAFKDITEAVAGGNAEIAKLPSYLQPAAHALQELQTAFEKLRTDTGPAVGKMFQDVFGAAKTIIGELAPIIKVAAEAFGELAKRAASFFQSPDFQNFSKFLQGNLIPIVKQLGEILFSVIGIVMNLTKAFMEMGGQQVLGMLVKAFQDIDKWASQLGQNKAFQEFMAEIIKDVPVVLEFLKQLATFIGHLITALSPLGRAILEVANAILKWLNSMPPDVMAAVALGIAAIVAALLTLIGVGNPLTALILVVLAVAAALKALYDHFEGFRTGVDAVVKAVEDFVAAAKEKLKPIWDELVILWNEKVVPAWNKVVEAFKDPKVQEAFKEIGDLLLNKLLPAIGDLAKVLVGDVIPAILNFVAAVTPWVVAFQKLVDGNMIQTLSKAIEVLAAVLKVASDILNVISDILRGDFKKAFEDSKKVVEDFGDVIGKVLGPQAAQKAKEFGDTINKQLETTFKAAIKLATDFGNNVNKSLEKTFKDGQKFATDFGNNVNKSLEKTFKDGIKLATDFGNNVNKSLEKSFKDAQKFANDFGTNVNKSLTKTFKDGLKAATDFGTAVNKAIDTAFKTAIKFVDTFGTNVNKSLTKTFKDALKFFTDFGTNANKAIDKALKDILKLATDFGDKINKAIDKAFKDVQKTIETAWKSIQDTVKDAVDQIIQDLEDKWDEFSQWWDDLWKEVGDAIDQAWKDMTDKVSQTVEQFISQIQQAWEEFCKAIVDAADSVAEGVGKAWDELKGKVKDAWDGIVKIVEDAVKAIADAIKTLTGGVNVVLSFFGLSTIPGAESGGTLRGDQLEQMASGGEIGGGFKTKGPTVIVGEGNQNYPEYVIPTDPMYRSNAMSLYQEAGSQLMAESGMRLMAAGGLVDPAASPGGADPVAFVTQLLAAATGSMPPPPMGGIGKGTIEKITAPLLDMIAAAVAAALAAIAAAAAAATAAAAAVITAESGANLGKVQVREIISQAQSGAVIMPSARQYDSGGTLSPGTTLAINRTGRDERVLTPDQTSSMDEMLSGGGGDNTELIDRLDRIAGLLERNGAGAQINVHGAQADPVEIARRTALNIRMR